MSDLLPDVWFKRDRPVLVEVARQVEAGRGRIEPEPVAKATGLSVDEVIRAGEVLLDRNLVTTAKAHGTRVLWFTGITGDAYQLTGLHPDPGTAVERLEAALQQAEAQAPEQERGKFRAVLDALRDMGQDVATQVVGAAITGRLPM
jgi:hypothetical protein